MITSAKGSEHPSIEQKSKEQEVNKKSHTEKIKTTKDKDISKVDNKEKS